MSGKINTSIQALAVIDPLNRTGKITVPLSETNETRGRTEFLKALSRGQTKDFSLCLLFQKDRCNAGDKCHQIHANSQLITKLRSEASRRSTCCCFHGDLYSQDWTALAQDLTVTVDDIAYPLHCFARTAQLDTVLARRKKSHSTVFVNTNRVCRLHQDNRCKFGRDCKNVHLCRNLAESAKAVPMTSAPSAATAAAAAAAAPTATAAVPRPSQRPQVRCAPQTVSVSNHSRSSTPASLSGDEGHSSTPSTPQSSFVSMMSFCENNSAYSLCESNSSRRTSPRTSPATVEEDFGFGVIPAQQTKSPSPTFSFFSDNTSMDTMPTHHAHSCGAGVIGTPVHSNDVGLNQVTANVLNAFNTAWSGIHGPATPPKTAVVAKNFWE